MKCEYESRCIWKETYTKCEVDKANGNPSMNCMHWMMYRIDDLEKRMIHVRFGDWHESLRELDGT